MAYPLSSSITRRLRKSHLADHATIFREHPIVHGNNEQSVRVARDNLSRLNSATKHFGLGEAGKCDDFVKPHLQRVHILKSQGPMRSIGILAMDDKIVQGAVREVSEALYEQDFLDCSYDFRARHSADAAIQLLNRARRQSKASWIREAGIESFFGRVDCTNLKQMLQTRTAEGSLLGFIGECLQRGILDGGKYSPPD